MAACLRRKSGRPRSFHRTERVSTPQENRTRSPYSFRLFLSIFINGRNDSPRRAPFATARDSFAHACRNAGCARYRGIAFFEYAPASVVITASLPQPLTMPVTPAKSSPTRSHPVCYRWQRSSAKRGLPLARQHPAGLRGDRRQNRIGQFWNRLLFAPLLDRDAYGHHQTGSLIFVP